MTTLKAIETVYNGYRFRSRLEARWAVFFDTLGIPYEYEKEGYDLDGVWYLPDFWLPKQECWVEIKGQEPTQPENLKASMLADLTRHPVYIFYGSIDPHFPSIASAHFPMNWVIYGHDPLSPCHGELPVSCECGEVHGCNSCPYETCVALPHEVSMAWLAAERKHKHDICDVTTVSDWVVCKDPDKFNQIEGEPLFMALPSPLNNYVEDLRLLISQHPHWIYSISTTEGPQADYHYWTECPHCHALGITNIGKTSHLPCKCFEKHDFFDNVEYNAIADRLKEAYTAARQARFGV